MMYLRRDGVDVLLDVGAERLLRQAAVRLVRAGLEHAVVVLQRELRIHRHQARGLGQLQHAIGARAVRERVLHLERARGHDVAHQRLELHFAERAARLLVAEQFLQADHAAGEAVDLLLRLVDGGEALHHVDEGLVGLLEALVQALAHLARDLLQALVDLGVQLLGGRGQLLDHRLAALARGSRTALSLSACSVSRVCLQLLGQRAAQALGRLAEVRCPGGRPAASGPPCRSVSMARCFSSRPCAMPDGNASSCGRTGHAPGEPARSRSATAATARATSIMGLIYGCDRTVAAVRIR